MLNLLLAMAIIWWVAYRWRSNEHWTFLLFIWLLLSPTILYLISSLLFPDQDDEQPITDWKVYFYENHRDIFLLYALIFPIDIADTLFKGMAHFRAQGPLYVMTMALWFVLCLVAAFTKRRYYHAFFCRDLPDLQPGVRWHYVTHRSRCNRRHPAVKPSRLQPDRMPRFKIAGHAIGGLPARRPTVARIVPRRGIEAELIGKISEIEEIFPSVDDVSVNEISW